MTINTGAKIAALKDSPTRFISADRFVSFRFVSFRFVSFRCFSSISVFGSAKSVTPMVLESAEL